MMIAQRPTWRRTATCRPIVGALLVALVACGTPAATTRGPVGDGPGALSPAAPVVSYEVWDMAGAPVWDAAGPSFAAIGDEIPASAYALAPSAPVVLDRARDAAVPPWWCGDDTVPTADPTPPGSDGSTTRCR